MKLTVSQIRKLLPIIPLFPITTFLSRLLEKWTSLARLLFQYFCMKLNLVGARDIEIMENGNHILVLNQDTALGAKGNLVQLPKDTVIYNFVLLHGCWEVEESKFLANLLDSRKSQSSMGALLDIGANTGLVSIQSSNLGISEFELLMIEPLTQHLEAIHFNLKLMNRSRNYKIFPGALSEKGGSRLSILNLRILEIPRF
jgi:hypothetical protein